MFKSATLAAATLSLVAAFGSVATTPAHAQSVKVAIGDLDLTSAKGKRTLERRIARASAAVCTSGLAHLDIGVLRSERRCREVTFRAARAEMARNA